MSKILGGLVNVRINNIMKQFTEFQDNTSFWHTNEILNVTNSLWIHKDFSKIGLFTKQIDKTPRSLYICVIIQRLTRIVINYNKQNINGLSTRFYPCRGC